MDCFDWAGLNFLGLFVSSVFVIFLESTTHAHVFALHRHGKEVENK